MNAKQRVVERRIGGRAFVLAAAAMAMAMAMAACGGADGGGGGGDGHGSRADGGGGTGGGGGGGRLETDDPANELDELTAEGAVAVVASAAPESVRSGAEVSLVVRVTSSRATNLDVDLTVRGPSGLTPYALALKAQPVRPDGPIMIEDALRVEATDPSGLYALDIAVRHSSTGTLLVQKAAAAQFTVATTPGCAPQCDAKQCGDDGCGGSCGSCSAGTCNGAGVCEGGTTAPSWPLKVSGDGRRLTYSSGEPNFYCADTGWVTLSRLSIADAKRYIDIKSSQGFNAIQASLTVWNRSNSGSRGAPFVGGDLTKPNDSYWAGIDELLEYMASKEMVAVLWPIWAADNGGWGGGSAPSSTSFATYCTWLGNRYASRGNILWALGGDEQYETLSGLFDGCAAALEAADPSHPKTFHPRWDNYGLRTKGWLDFNSIQHNDNTSPMVYERVRSGYELAPVKPILLAEPPYYPGTAVGNVATSRQRNRQNGWLTALAGAMGVVYGGSRTGTWNIGADGVYDWSATADVTGADTGNIRKVLTRFHWERLVPDWGAGVVTSSRGSYGQINYVGAARANDGSLLGVYLPNGGSATVNLAQLSGAATAEWYDPSTGEVSGGALDVASTGTRVFTPPGNNAAGANDWALLIATAAGRAGGGSVCTPQCSGRQCGQDGCGGVCGTCSAGTCSAAGQCMTGGDTVTTQPDTAVIGGVSRALAGFNIARGANAMVLYGAPQTNTGTNIYGHEAVVENDVITSIEDRQTTNAGPTAVPPNGYVLSEHNGTPLVLASAHVGDRVVLMSGDKVTTWRP